MGDRTIIVSSPGKIILTGEHAVVYGKKGVAASLNLRTYLRLEVCEDNRVSLELPDIDIAISWTLEDIRNKLVQSDNTGTPEPLTDDTINCLKSLATSDKWCSDDVRHLAVVAFLYLYGSLLGSKCERERSIKVKVNSWLPPGAGLGSSAAYATCLSAAMLIFSGHIPRRATSGWSPHELDTINGWAFNVEKIIHGRPSGIDNAVSCYGGVLSFCSGTIVHLDRPLAVQVLLVNTKVPRSTKALVAAVRAKYDKYPTIIGPVFDAIDAISNQTVAILEDSQSANLSDNYNSLKELFAMNQRLLGLLGVSHVTLDDLTSLAGQHGLQAKLTGAGGGGCAFILITPDTPESAVTSVETALQDKCQCWRTVAGGAGLVHHDTYAPDDLYNPPDTFTTDAHRHTSSDSQTPDYTPPATF